MSHPVFYMMGGIALVALILAVLSFALFHITALGVILTIVLIASIDFICWKVYSDIEALAQKLRDVRYRDVRLVDMSELVFGSERRTAMMMLGHSRMLLGRK